MTTIHLGPNNTAPCNLESLIETKLLVQGNSGAGKSFTIRRLLEQTHAHVQHFVLDVEGDFGTLREKFAYALIGPDGDCPADPRTAGPLALKLLELGVSAIADISELTEPERDEFVANFLQSLMSAPKRLWRPLLVVVDEAHKACPEVRNTLSKPHVIDLMTRGRKRAFGAVIATQRVALLANTAIAEANNKLVGRCVLAPDIKRIGDECGFISATRRELRTLQPGEFYAFGSALGDEVHRIRIGEVVTTHPRPGTTRSAALPPAPKALASALAQLAKLVPPPSDEPEEHSTGDDPELLAELERLRARVAELEAQPPPISEELVRRLEFAVDHLQRTSAAASELAQEVLHALPGDSATSVHSDGTDQLPQPEGRPRPQKAAPSSAHAKRPDVPGKDGLSKCARGLLASLAQHGRMTLTQAAIVAGYSPKSSTVANASSELKVGGYVDGSNTAGLDLTGKGKDITRGVRRLPTGAKLAEHWYGKISKCARLMLQAVIARYPGAMSMHEAARVAGYSETSSTVANAASELRTLCLVHGSNAGMTADRRLV